MGTCEQRIISIVPQLPPAIDGVGDYASQLAVNMWQKYGCKTDFIVGSSEWNISQASLEPNDACIHVVSNRSKQTLLSLLDKYVDIPSTVLLHYVGYGYAKRGCPIWLVQALEEWKQQKKNHYLVTMFHEIYAFGPIWTSQFWISPLQRKLAARLSRCSDRCLTSQENYAKTLNTLRKQKDKSRSIPIFSCIGEPENIPPFQQRQRQLIVFGGGGSRSRVYENSFSTLENICKQLKIKKIIDIGPPLPIKIPIIDGVHLEHKGILSHAEIRELMLSALVGFLDYPSDYLAKSSIFASYSAHGLLPIIPDHSLQSGALDGLRANEQYLVWPSQTTIAGQSTNERFLDIQMIADNAWKWYCDHDLNKQTDIFHADLLPNS